MKLNTNSNIYTVVYSMVLVIIVAAGLAFAAIQLQPLQEANVRIEKMQNILKSVGIETTVEDAQAKYDKYVTKQFAVNQNGEVIIKGETQAEKDKVFGINLKLQFKNFADKKDVELPVYVAEVNGKTRTIIPLRGKGLWGPIWGYFALEEDFNTIAGAVFDHKGETPGLGADISKDWFQKQFKGKTIFEGDKLVSITAHKGGAGAAAAAGDMKHGIDAISGGTITSKGLEAMVKDDWLFAYKSFLEKNKK